MNSDSIPSAAPKSRIEQYLDLMVYIIQADGVVEPEESEHLLALMEGMRLDNALLRKYHAMLEDSPFPLVTDEQLRGVVEGLDPDSLQHLILDAYKLAFSDGEVQGEELDLIRRTLMAAAIPAERLEHIDSWARHTLELSAMGRALFLPE